MHISAIKDFIKKYQEWFTVLGLGIIFYFIFFHNIGNYALMDVDETRYVSMARDMFNSKDFLTLYLNGEYFFEKPPLYFWLECFSFWVFNVINEFSARFPVALCGMVTCFGVYFTARKVVSREFGLISSLILATSIEYVILAKFAILDIVVTACIGLSILFGFMTFFCKETNKKYFWWLFYIFSGLAVMAKGIPGFVAPFGSMFILSVITKKFKEIFRPQYFLVGLGLFLLIVIPWHWIMLKIHNPLFYDEYIIKHHLKRFLSSDEINRAQPFWFYFVTLLWGLVPWIFSVLAVWIVKIKDFNLKNLKLKLDISSLDNKQKFILFNTVTFVFILLFFTSSKTKLITYILPVFAFVAPLIAIIWSNYINNGLHKKAINLSVYIWGGICIFASVVAMFTKFFLPEQLYNDILPAKWLCISILGLFGVASILFTKKEKYWGVFFSYVMFSLLLSAFGTKVFYEIDYKFGQNDLMEFAKYVQTTDKKLVSFGDRRRYSLMYYYGSHINYIEPANTETLKEELSRNNSYISARKKMLKEFAGDLEYDVVIEGRKFNLIKSK